MHTFFLKYAFQIFFLLLVCHSAHSLLKKNSLVALFTIAGSCIHSCAYFIVDIGSVLNNVYFLHLVKNEIFLKTMIQTHINVCQYCLY